jgi:polygalacturonase
MNLPTQVAGSTGGTRERRTTMKRLMLKKFALSSVLGLSMAGAAMAGNPTNQFVPPRVPEPKIPHRTVQVTDFGAVPDGKTLNTAAIAKGISELAKKGGGRLVFPPGIWLTGPIELKNKIELHLEEGALVQFTRDFHQYPNRELDMKGRKYTVTTSPICGENLEDIAITGQGVMDGGGDAWRPVKHSKMTAGQWQRLLSSGGVVQPGKDEIWWPSNEAMKDRRPVLLKLVSCRKVLLDGVTFQNSPAWNLNPTLCEDVTIRNVTARNAWYSQNGDGLDLVHCRNVIVRGSRFDVGDDAICLKSGADAEGRRVGVPTENVLIEDCIVYHGHGGVTIGSEMSSGVRNVRVNNCTFMGTDIGLRFKSLRGRGGVVEKIFISNVRMTDIATDAIGFNLYYEGRAPAEGGSVEAKPEPVNEGTPQFRDVYIQDVICLGAERAVALQGLPEMPIRGIHLRNVSISAKLGMSCSDAQDITLDNVEIRNRQGPVVNLAGSHDVRIDHLSCQPGAEALFEAQGADNSGIIIRNTDLKTAAKDFLLSNGAMRDAFKVE